jgi:hypothetical protein
LCGVRGAIEASSGRVALGAPSGRRSRASAKRRCCIVAALDQPGRGKSMKPVACCCLGITLLPAVLQAGILYGSVTAAGRSVSRTPVEINCDGAITRGLTLADGSYRINVRQQGQCNLMLPSYPNRPFAVVFSYPKPAQYDFDLVKRQDGRYELRRR